MDTDLILSQKPDFEVIKTKLLSNNNDKNKFNNNVLNDNTLTKPFFVNNLNFKNHFAFINLTDVEFFDDNKENLSDYYINLAKSNVGLIITGGIDFKMLNNKAFLGDSNLFKMRELINQIHTFGTKIFLQIKQFYGRGISKNKYFGRLNYSPSFNYSYDNLSTICSRITDYKCNEMIYEIKKITNYAKNVGYDGILINGDMFNIIGEFSSYEFNRRYFGYYSNIGELSIKILKSIKKEFSKFNIFYSITVDSFLKEIYGNQLKSIKTTSKIKCQSDFNFMCKFLIELVNNGVDGFIFNFGTYENEFLNSYNEFQDEYLFFDYYKFIKDYFVKNNIKNKFGNDVVIIYKDNINYLNKANRYLKNELFDFVDITKQIYADKNFIYKLNSDEQYKPCIKCSYCNYCANEFNINTCFINPELFDELTNKSDEYLNKKIAIIGAGLSGLMCAIYLMKRGYFVDIYDKNEIINLKRRNYEIFNFCKLTNNFNNYIENMIIKNANNCHFYLKTAINSQNISNNAYDIIILATGTKEKPLSIYGSILKSVKSINDVFLNKTIIDKNKNFVVLLRSELSLKFSLYLLTKNKHVTIIIQNFRDIEKISNDKFTYYFYELVNLGAKIYIEANVQKIENDFVEILIKQNFNRKNILSSILNLKNGFTNKMQNKLISIDYDCFIYEPELIENNKLYYDIVSSGYTGEIYMIGNALKICDDAECIKSAYFVAKNL